MTTLSPFSAPVIVSHFMNESDLLELVAGRYLKERPEIPNDVKKFLVRPTSIADLFRWLERRILEGDDSDGAKDCAPVQDFLIKSESMDDRIRFLSDYFRNNGAKNG